MSQEYDSGAYAASRAAGLARLAAFVPCAGRHYAAKRNTDCGPGANVHVSGLSPYIRHRLITEREVVAAVLAEHRASVVDKFIQEVCWRTYWKGWLEQRPGVWSHYVAEISTQRAGLRDDSGLAAAVAAAERGDTGIACFDAWAAELVATGYLHNHARMWFASIWIFTLKLPWVLGADFFMRHLLDGDPASNTLSWRWVGGLHTRGKTYLARADNIETFTNGRFKPEPDTLAAYATPLMDDVNPERSPLASGHAIPSDARLLLLVTDEDLAPELWAIDNTRVTGVAVLDTADAGPSYSPGVRAFKAAARADAMARAQDHFRVAAVTVAAPEELAVTAKAAGADVIVTPRVPVGPLKGAVSELVKHTAAQSLPLLQIMHPWDSQFWPHAKAGFFQLKEKIPRVLADLGIGGTSL